MATDNYLQRLSEVLWSLRLPQGSVTHIFIAHDDWCALWRGGRCNCDPILKVCRGTSPLAIELGRLAWPPDRG